MSLKYCDSCGVEPADKRFFITIEATAICMDCKEELKSEFV